MKTLKGTLLFTVAALALQTAASAATLTVSGDANIFAAGHTFLPGGSGSLPPSLSFASGQFNLLTFGGVSGSVSLNGGGNFNNADGVGAAVGSSSTSSVSGISGITAPNAGYLVGVFEPATEPGDPAPASLDFTTLGTSFSTLAPVLDQTFFIGDGLTGNGTGTVQKFTVPAGATRLFLGISDAGGYNGSPGSYADNSGSFSATFTLVPEPSSFLLAGLGIAAALVCARRKRPA